MAKASSTHEALGSEDEVKMGSERSFGIVFCVVFLIIALLPLLSGKSIRLWPLAPAAIFLLAGLFAPTVLRPLNRIWFKFGMLIGRVMNPVVMGLLFLVAFVPMGFIIRYVVKKDLLRLKLDPDATSYWIERDPPGPEPASMKNQF